ncbi:tyrosinase inhibitor-like [Lucilia cuprina]|uniref:tyrosinase inhibitor-like n=1 Tax=Lucilia cuprina TaxID=7375 RepID=UPI001F0697FC|nr:tyrosinase inhibitor-like [Lucilia cuprina]
MKFCILIFLIVAILAAFIPIAPANPILENVETYNEIENQTCTPIGGRCYYSEQCCSKRCLSYTAKCLLC